MNVTMGIKIKTLFQILLVSTSLMIISYDGTAQSTGPWIAPKEANNLKNPYAGNSEAIKAGKKIYIQLCVICHGDKGKGDGMAGVALNPKPSNFSSEKVQAQSDGAIFWKMSNGRAPMAAYKELIPEKERWQLVAYIRTLKSK